MLAAVDDAHRAAAERMRRALSTGRATPAALRAALTSVPASERDGWLDCVFGLGEIPDDGPELPRGCVPYLPASVDTVLRMIEIAEVRSDDVFVDVGCGLGRALALTHLLTGADAIGLEIQSTLVRGARELVSRLNTPRVSVIEGDAVRLTRHVAMGSVFFFYCPFGGARLERVMDDLESIAGTRTIRVCTVGLPSASRSWLAPVSSFDDLTVYRSGC
jgi:SAM-dependent methyltransferase